MKKITKSFVAIFAIATLFISCSKDDSSPEPVSKDPIVGKWIVDNAVVSLPDSDPETLDINGTCPDKSYLNLKSDGNFEEGNTNSQTCAFTISKGQWIKEDNSLDITFTGGAKASIEVALVTANKLTLRINNYAGLPEGTIVEYNYTKKQ